MKRQIAFLLAGLLSVASAYATESSKIGFVNSERVLRDAPVAIKAQKKLEKEFERRDQELQKLAQQIKSMEDSLQKNGITLSESDRRNKERDFNDLNRDFQRKQREFREDLNQRRNEELAAVVERANKAIKQIAEAEKFDLILQEAVYFSPRIDITDKVIKALGDSAK